MAFKFSSTNNPAPTSDIPQGDNIDKEAWKLAEEAVRSRNGGFSGVSEEGKYHQIKEAYDQMVDNNDQARKWDGTEDDGM